MSELPECCQKSTKVMNIKVARVYSDRNNLVALLSTMYPASLERHQGDVEPGWTWVVVLDLPTGQASWHVPDADLDLFAHLPREDGRKWDGHSTREKVTRILQHLSELRS